MATFARLNLNESDIKTTGRITRADYFPLTACFDTEVGTIAIGNTEVTWKDIDLRAVMGALWGKYDLYTLQLCQFYTTPYANHSTNAFSNPFEVNVYRERGLVDVYICGLQWVHSSYSPLTKCDRSLALVCTLSEYINGYGDTWPQIWSSYDEAGTVNNQLWNLNPLLFKPAEQTVNLTLNFAPNILGRLVKETDTDLLRNESYLFHQFRSSWVIRGVGEPKAGR